EGAEWLGNPNGTAPGIWLEQAGATIIILPRPPRELEAMFESARPPPLARPSTGDRLRSRVYKVVGLPESEVDQRISPTYKTPRKPLHYDHRCTGGHRSSPARPCCF